MSTRELHQLRTHAEQQAALPSTPSGEQQLWRRIAGEVAAYERAHVLAPIAPGACSVCRETNGRHRSLANGRFVHEHDESEGLLW
ncbi:hypothetical protein [Serinicoccus sediminis]|uniref:hypothetical protein n=1 Tax=Serinicoccus sediminis TaxID=2306021 RepID=UPI00102238C7|nr:hypothetical protein [Serinicoccus sediminis]